MNISGLIHKRSGTDEFNDFRFACKTMANILSVRKMPSPPPWGRFPFKKVTEDVRKGNPTLYDLSRWYDYALPLVRRKERV